MPTIRPRRARREPPVDNSRRKRFRLEDFFEEYPDFDWDRTGVPTDEFRRLSKFKGWNELQREAEIVPFRQALIDEFDTLYGKRRGPWANDGNVYLQWPKVCKVMNMIGPIPQDMGQCQEMFMSAYINIIDMIHLPNLPPDAPPLKVFETVEELSKYTKRTGRYFPARNVPIGGDLGLLLRHIKGLDGGVEADKPRRNWSRPRGQVPGAAQLTKSQKRNRRRRLGRALKAKQPKAQAVPNPATDALAAQLSGLTVVN